LLRFENVDRLDVKPNRKRVWVRVDRSVVIERFRSDQQRTAPTGQSDKVAQEDVAGFDPLSYCPLPSSEARKRISSRLASFPGLRRIKIQIVSHPTTLGCRTPIGQVRQSPQESTQSSPKRDPKVYGLSEGCRPVPLWKGWCRLRDSNPRPHHYEGKGSFREKRLVSST
jgi:hypothetical protein